MGSFFIAYKLLTKNKEDGSMVAKKRRIGIVLLLMVSLVLWGCSSGNDSEASAGEGKVFKIGIDQLVEHPALDSAREGFIAGLESKGFKDGEKVTIDFENAQGDIPTTQLIAQNFLSNKVDMIFAIATPAAQSAFNATKEVPILFTAVTDPVDAGLAESWESSNNNVTGTSDVAPIEEQFPLLKKLVPGAKKVGTLYNTSEVNSELQIEKAKELASELDLELITSGVSNSNELPQAIDALIDKIDVLYVPTDNLIASSMALIVDKCNGKDIPVIGAERAHVEAGALATIGINYYDLGFQTGLMAAEVLEGKEPKDIPIATLEKTELVINEDSAKTLNIEIPEDLKEEAELIKGGGKS